MSQVKIRSILKHDTMYSPRSKEQPYSTLIDSAQLKKDLSMGIHDKDYPPKTIPSILLQNPSSVTDVSTSPSKGQGSLELFSPPKISGDAKWIGPQSSPMLSPILKNSESPSFHHRLSNPKLKIYCSTASDFFKPASFKTKNVSFKDDITAENASPLSPKQPVYSFETPEEAYNNELKHAQSARIPDYNDSQTLSQSLVQKGNNIFRINSKHTGPVETNTNKAKRKPCIPEKKKIMHFGVSSTPKVAYLSLGSPTEKTHAVASSLKNLATPRKLDLSPGKDQQPSKSLVMDSERCSTAQGRLGQNPVKVYLSPSTLVDKKPEVPTSATSEYFCTLESEKEKISPLYGPVSPKKPASLNFEDEPRPALTISTTIAKFNAQLLKLIGQTEGSKPQSSRLTPEGEEEEQQEEQEESIIEDLKRFPPQLSDDSLELPEALSPPGEEALLTTSMSPIPKSNGLSMKRPLKKSETLEMIEDQETKVKEIHMKDNKNNVEPAKQNFQAYKDAENNNLFEINEDNFFLKSKNHSNINDVIRASKRANTYHAPEPEQSAPMIVSYLGRNFTIQPKFMEKNGSMCFTELWSGKSKSTYAKVTKSTVNLLRKASTGTEDAIYRPAREIKQKNIQARMSANKAEGYGSSTARGSDVYKLAVIPERTSILRIINGDTPRGKGIVNSPRGETQEVKTARNLYTRQMSLVTS